MVRFLDLGKKYSQYKKEIDSAVNKTLKSGWFILGKELESFEANFAKFLGVKYAVGVNSGTDALFLALKALGIKRGDEVITVANTATPTISAIRMAGGVPVFVDISERDYNIAPELIESKITKKTRFIIPVHLFGYPAEMDGIKKIARKHKLKVIEDTAQATGAKYKNRYAGTLGDAGCFSFYPTKNLGAFGDAGAIVTNNRKTAEIVRQLRNYGEISKYNNIREGVNSRLDEIQASILNWGLKKINIWNRKRESLAKIYLKQLKDLPLILPPSSDDQHSCVWHLFVVRVRSRDKLMQYLKVRGIDTAIHYPKPVYKQIAYNTMKYRGKLPMTEHVMSEILSLPLYPELSRDEVMEVCQNIRSYYEQQ